MKRISLAVTLFLISGMSFSIIYFMFGLPVEAILYAWVLSVFMGSVVLLLHGWRYYKARTQVKHIKEAPDKVGILSKTLPVPMDELEQDYQSLILELMTERQKVITDVDIKFSELTDYYTLWVHQVKTPISALDLMFQTEPDTEKLRAMKLELFKIEQYVEMALHIMRLDEDASDLMLSPCLLENLCAGAVKKYRSLFIEKKIKLKMDIKPIMVISDEKWMTVVLEQLVSNALKYTSKGEIHIYNEEDNPQILYIKDTGIGIHAEDLPRIFEKGFTGYNGRVDKKATGIGLYLTRRICEKLSMSIAIESELDQGTQVRLQFIPYSHVSLEMKM
jgi:signal transduction histidine kinase